MASTEKKGAAHTAALYSSACPRAESGFPPSGVGSEGYAVDAATGWLRRRLTSAFHPAFHRATEDALHDLGV